MGYIGDWERELGGGGDLGGTDELPSRPINTNPVSNSFPRLKLALEFSQPELQLTITLFWRSRSLIHRV